MPLSKPQIKIKVKHYLFFLTQEQDTSPSAAVIQYLPKLQDSYTLVYA